MNLSLNLSPAADSHAGLHSYAHRPQRDHLCLTCRSEWSVSHCWSCQIHWVDSRGPQTPPGLCRWLNCAFGSACDWNGCRQRTNPYHRGFTYRDAQLRIAARFAASAPPEDDSEDDYDWQDDADSGWESYVGVSRDDPTWDMMEEIAVDGMFERSERN